MEQNENTLSVLKIAPGQHPQQVEIDNNLKALQQAAVSYTHLKQLQQFVAILNSGSGSTPDESGPKKAR